MTKELFQAAITLRGSVKRADYKRYVLPIIFLRFLSLRDDRHHQAARPVFLNTREDILALLPPGHDYGAWQRMSGPQIEDLYSLVYGVLAEDEMRRDDFLDAEARLTAGFLLVKHLGDCRGYADEVIFCQRVRNQLFKALPGRKAKGSVEQAVRDLVDDAVEAEGVVDIFTAAGIERADISVLDDKFLQTFKDRPQQNLRLMLLERLLADEILRRQARNLTQSKSFRELLEKTLQRYHSRLIDAAAVVAEMLRMKKEMDTSDARARALGLAEEEVAFHDAVASNPERVYDEPFLCDVVHDVVQTIKRNLKVDWTEPHRDQVQAETRAAVRARPAQARRARGGPRSVHRALRGTGPRDVRGLATGGTARNFFFHPVSDVLGTVGRR